MIKETEEYIYEIKENKIAILKYKMDNSIVEIPQMLFGLPVVELGDYVVSGKNCQSIFIPDGVKKIGRYGFYNCRNLEHLSFSSEFMDIGSGAFTGCHKIKKIDIKMNTEESCLKEILQEVPEEVEVHLKGMINAHLWFPEFFEEGVENTPARILMTQIHGSGLYYRNCFTGKKFNFLEYDRRFLMAQAQESQELLIELVYGRLSAPYNLAEKEKKIYEDFLENHIKDVMIRFIVHKKEERIYWILKNFQISKEDYEKIMEMALEKKMPDVISVLMNYGKSHYQTKRKSFDL